LLGKCEHINSETVSAKLYLLDFSWSGGATRIIALKSPGFSPAATIAANALVE
jgi:hypothetical protein